MLTKEKAHGKIMVLINKFRQENAPKFVKNDKNTRRNTSEEIRQ